MLCWSNIQERLPRQVLQLGAPSHADMRGLARVRELPGGVHLRRDGRKHVRRVRIQLPCYVLQAQARISDVRAVGDEEHVRDKLRVRGARLLDLQL